MWVVMFRGWQTVPHLNPFRSGIWQKDAQTHMGTALPDLTKIPSLLQKY